MRNVAASYLLLALCSFFSFFQPISSAAEPKDPKAVLAEIDAELARGKHEARACDKFKKKFKKIISGGLSIESPSHLSKKQALDYLEALEKYPSHPVSFRRAHEMFEANAELVLGQAPQPLTYSQLMASYQQECMMFSVQVHMTLLFRDVAAFEFSKGERAKVERLAKRYFSTQGEFLATATAAAKGKALETYLDKVYQGVDREALLQRVKEINQNVKARQDGIRMRLERADAKTAADAVETTRMEIKAAGEFGAAFSEVLKSAKL